jgi:hypothetical protein
MAPGKLGVCLNLFLEGIYDSLIFETGIYGSFTLQLYKDHYSRNWSKKWKQLIIGRDLIEIGRHTTEIAREIGPKS